jgi:uncharacterized protein DUF5615
VTALYTDADIAPAFVTMLSERGHDVMTALQLDLRVETDDVHLVAATDLHRVLVTHNGADFVLLHAAWRSWSALWNVTPPPRHAGVISVPQNQLITFQESTGAIDALLSGDQTIWDAIWVLQWNTRAWRTYA